MAKRRMFSLEIVDTDAFLEMPSSTQSLYFHFGMRADDEGFVGNPRRLIRMLGVSEDDYKLLIAKSFVIPFESGVCVIKHWKMNNYLQNDRLKPTTYLDEKKLLAIKENKAYTLDDKRNVYKLDTECIHSIDKSSIVENSNNTSSITSNTKIPYKRIMDYFKQVTGKNYTHTAKKTQQYIKQRWDEQVKAGRNSDEIYELFKDAIKNTYQYRMEQGGDLTFVRPDVIFNGDFEKRAFNDSYSGFTQSEKIESHDRLKKFEKGVK